MGPTEECLRRTDPLEPSKSRQQILDSHGLDSVCRQHAQFLLEVRVETLGPQLWEQGLQSQAHPMQLKSDEGPGDLPPWS